jgi:hypothetical protein
MLGHGMLTDDDDDMRCASTHTPRPTRVALADTLALVRLTRSPSFLGARSRSRTPPRPSQAPALAPLRRELGRKVDGSRGHNDEHEADNASDLWADEDMEPRRGRSAHIGAGEEYDICWRWVEEDADGGYATLYSRESRRSHGKCPTCQTDGDSAGTPLLPPPPPPPADEWRDSEARPNTTDRWTRARGAAETRRAGHAPSTAPDREDASTRMVPLAPPPPPSITARQGTASSTGTSSRWASAQDDIGAQRGTRPTWRSWHEDASPPARAMASTTCSTSGSWGRWMEPRITEGQQKRNDKCVKSHAHASSSTDSR